MLVYLDRSGHFIKGRDSTSKVEDCSFSSQLSPTPLKPDRVNALEAALRQRPGSAPAASDWVPKSKPCLGLQWLVWEWEAKLPLDF